MDIRFKPNKVLEAKIKDFMTVNGLSAPRAVRAMLGDMTALYGHETAEQGRSSLLDTATPVRLSVFDELPKDRRGIGKHGYIMTVVKNFVFEMQQGESILVQHFEGRNGEHVKHATVAACINQTYRKGAFSVITRGVPNGQYIVRRNP